MEAIATVEKEIRLPRRDLGWEIEWRAYGRDESGLINRSDRYQIPVIYTLRSRLGKTGQDNKHKPMKRGARSVMEALSSSLVTWTGAGG